MIEGLVTEIIKEMYVAKENPSNALFISGTQLQPGTQFDIIDSFPLYSAVIPNKVITWYEIKVNDNTYYVSQAQLERCCARLK